MDNLLHHIKEKMRQEKLPHYAAKRAGLDYDSFFEDISSNTKLEDLRDNFSKSTVRWMQKKGLGIILQ